jgi:membrane fusion protein, multidrug efflux system
MKKYCSTRLRKLAFGAGLSWLCCATAVRAAPEAAVVSCLLEPSQQVAVASPVAGVVSRILVERGDMVKAGDKLFELESAVEQANLAQASARLKLVKAKYLRNQALVQEGILSEQEAQELEAEHELAGAAHAEAQAMLARRTVVAPISGVVVKRLLSAGEQVSGGPVLRLANLNPLHADLTLRASQFGQFRPGMRLRVAVAGGETILNGRVRQVDPVIDAASGTYSVSVELANPASRVPAGLGCALR